MTTPAEQAAPTVPASKTWAQRMRDQRKCLDEAVTFLQQQRPGSRPDTAEILDVARFLAAGSYPW